jgi:hypothetical protein
MYEEENIGSIAAPSAAIITIVIIRLTRILPLERKTPDIAGITRRFAAKRAEVRIIETRRIKGTTSGA